MTDITVSRELLRQVLNEYEFAFAPTVATKALRAALDAEPAPVQEPVAFVSPDDLDAMCNPEYAPGAHFRMRKTPAGKYVQPIYTAQPRKAVKLSDSEIEKLQYEHVGVTKWFPNLARAIEQAVLKANGVEE